jgi:hypothetical protein
MKLFETAALGALESIQRRFSDFRDEITAQIYDRGDPRRAWR